MTDIVELLITRLDQDFDDVCSLSRHEAVEIHALVASLRSRAETAEAALREAVEQEPVAWLYAHPVIGALYRNKRMPEKAREAYAETPLYPAPAAAAAAFLAKHGERK